MDNPRPVSRGIMPEARRWGTSLFFFLPGEETVLSPIARTPPEFAGSKLLSYPRKRPRE